MKIQALTLTLWERGLPAINDNAVSLRNVAPASRASTAPTGPHSRSRVRWHE
jgi:hypothetical protein